ncbi:MAG: SRPBCC family protein [Spartobacteria bacterium]
MKMHIDQDRIEKQIELKAPLTKVWRALTDYREFSEWFGVDLKGPFVPGETTAGQITVSGYEHIRMEVKVQEMEPERLFSYTWHPYAIEPDVDYSAEPPTLVEFRLEKTAGGTLLTVSESGFSKIPAARRDEAFRMNDGGWSQQIKDIQSHVEQTE